MKIPDANILVYAHDENSPFHARARGWFLDALSERSDPVGLAPVACLAFLRLICNPKVFQRPVAVPEGCKAVMSWLNAGAIWLEPEKDHFLTVGRLIEESHGSVNLITDAHLAALAIDRRATLYSNDRDFTRFKGLRLRNPLE